MKTTVPSTSNTSPADLKGVAGSGLATNQAGQCPVTLSPTLKEEIQLIINKYAANKTSLTPAEFRNFLKQEQQVVLHMLD